MYRVRAKCRADYRTRDRNEYPDIRQVHQCPFSGRSLQRLHFRGKIWPRIKAVAEANDCVSNMLKVLNAARAVKLRVFYAMHHRYRAGDYDTWTYIARFNEPRGSTRASNMAHGVASFVPNSCRRQVRLSQRNTGVPVASPTPTWTCSSRSTASISSSSSDSSRIPASKRPCAMPPSSVMTSPLLRMRRRTTQTR